MNLKSGWQLNEDGPEAYEKYIVPAFSGAWAKDIVDRANLHTGDRILDLGCGTGIVSRYAYQFISESLSIAGLDANEVVLNKAREICSHSSIPIDFTLGHAEALPFRDAEFDVVLCQQGLQYFPNRPLALTEVNRVLASRGRLVFSVWRPLKYHPFYLALHKALVRYVSAEVASTLSSAYTLGDGAQLRELFESVGFINIEMCIIIKQMRYSPLLDFLVGGLAASPFARDISKLQESKRMEMFQSIQESMSNYMDDHGLAAPMESHIVLATK